MANSRKLALKALLKVHSLDAYSNLTLNTVLKESDANHQEKAFATALFYGVLERQITLDFCLNSLLKSPLKKVSPLTLEALRIGLYQIMYMDSVPPFSAVDESVKLVKRSKESKNSGFVNAVLRNALRNEIKFPEGDDIKSLSVRYSCPEHIIESLISDYGKEDAAAYLEETLRTPELTVRVNTVKTDAAKLKGILEAQGVSVKEGIADNSLDLSGTDSIESLEGYKEGYFHIQDSASGLVCGVLAPENRQRVLDVCAAPGGKSFTLAEIMQNEGEIVACDLYEHRVGLISQGAKRLGLDIITPKKVDACVFDGALGEFDCVLCDVPCSGYGIIRRKPDIKYKSAEDFESLEKTQQSILNNAKKYLKKGGKLLYSTCTLRKAENNNQIKKFLEENSDFNLRYEHTYMPHKDKTDGFYCALLVRT